MNHSKTNRGTGGGHRRAREELASEDSYRKSKTNNHICSRRRDATRPHRAGRGSKMNFGYQSKFQQNMLV